jgi:SAM-dependent methyltransferase
LGRLIDLLRLPRGARVVDIACGKAEFLVRLVESYGVKAVGVDISPFFVTEAERNVEERVPGSDISLKLMNGADFRPDEPESFALSSCIGASWIFGGHEGTLDVLIGMTEPGGWVVVGEPYWLQEPPAEYLAASGDGGDSFGSHHGNADAGEKRGLELVHTIVSNKDDWDTYEGLQWYATESYARSTPDDPDLPELVGQVEKARDTYLRWGRDTLGWALYLFRRRP